MDYCDFWGNSAAKGLLNGSPRLNPPMTLLSNYLSPKPAQTAPFVVLIGGTRRFEPSFPVTAEAGNVPARKKLDNNGDRRWPPSVQEQRHPQQTARTKEGGCLAGSN